MKSYAQERLPAKKIKKLAGGFSDEEIRASLGPDVERLYVREARGGGALVGCWTGNGPIEFMNDDDVLNYAQTEFLKRNRYAVFSSDAELEAYALERGWPVRK